LRAPREFQIEIPPIIARRAAKKSAGKGLSFAQEARLKELVAGQPDQLALPGLRWSRRDLIVVTQRLFGITIDSHLAAAYLERWGVEPKAPSGQDLEADIIRFLEDHSTDWLKVSEIAQGVGCSMQRANSALMALADAGGHGAENGGGHGETAAPAHGAETGVAYPLKTTVVNLASDSDHRFAKVSITLEGQDAATIDRLKELDHQVYDSLIEILGNVRAQDVATDEGKERLKDSIRERLNRLVPDNAGVKSVYLTEFLVQ
jgi:flagellar basal body-associated protein FliL